MSASSQKATPSLDYLSDFKKSSKGGELRGVFRTQSKIFDRAGLRKW